MFKFITLFVFLLSTYILADEKIKGTYLGQIEDKYKNTYPVTTNLEITDEGLIKVNMNTNMEEKIGMVFFMMENCLVKIC